MNFAKSRMPPEYCVAVIPEAWVPPESVPNNQADIAQPIKGSVKNGLHLGFVKGGKEHTNPELQ